MSDFTLDQLVQEAGDDGFSTERGKTFKFEIAYPVVITGVKPIVNPKGRYSVVLKMGRLNVDGSVSKGDDAIVGLPVLTDEAIAANDPEAVQAYKNATGNAFMNVLRALMPDMFAVYHHSVKVGSRTKYYLEDGMELTYKEVEKRKKVLTGPTVALAKRVVKGESVLVGAKAYFVWNPNKKNPQFPYANFWSEPPNNHPMAE